MFSRITGTNTARTQAAAATVPSWERGPKTSARLSSGVCPKLLETWLNCAQLFCGLTKRLAESLTPCSVRGPSSGAP